MPTQIELGIPRKPESENGQEGKEEAFNLIEFVKEVKSEFTKISWPSKAQITNEFFSVLILVSAITGIIFLIDKVFNLAVKFLTGRMF